MMGVFVQVNGESRRAASHPIGYVIQENGCWDWIGALNIGGYGVWRIDGKTPVAHRVIYERLKGAVPSGLELDHLCRNRKCVNPDHLEAVTRLENVKRGLGAKRTHCPQGHPLAGANLYLFPNGTQKCKRCRREGMRRASASA